MCFYILEAIKRMGGIIIDGAWAGLRFKGSLSEFAEAIVGLGKLQKKLGESGLMIDTAPLPEGGIIIDLRFKGPMSEFEKVILGLEELRARVAIDTVPLPEQPKIGTWPTPEKPTAPWRWTISVKVE